MQTGEDHDHTTWWPLADYDCPWTREQGPLLEMAHLPEAGFRLGKTPADDLMSANHN